MEAGLSLFPAIYYNTTYIIKEDSLMQKVKMNVQTAYHGSLLRVGKVYEVDEETAQRWIESKIAENEKTEEM